jgi:hypothetical protein
MRQTFRNQTASIIFIYLERFGRYEFSKGALQFGILVKKSAANQKRWQISKNDLCRFDSQFSIESKNEIKLGRFHLKKYNFSVFIILGHLYTGCPRTGSPEKKGSLRANILTCILKKKSPISNDNREKTF